MSHPPMPRGLNFPPSGYDAPASPPPHPEPTRGEMRRSLLIEISNEMEVLEREHSEFRKHIQMSFDLAWDEVMGKAVLPQSRLAIKQRLGL